MGNINTWNNFNSLSARDNLPYKKPLCEKQNEPLHKLPLFKHVQQQINP